MSSSPAAMGRESVVGPSCRVALVAAVVFLGIPRPVPAQDRPPDAASGRKLAETHCSGCHAVGADGTSPLAGAPPLRELKLRYPLESLAEALAEGIETAHPQMPVFTFQPDEIDDLLAYLDGLG